mgnify:CR=1 FL=1
MCCFWIVITFFFLTLSVCVVQLQSDLDQLGMDYVDLILLHGPNLKADHLGACDATACAANVAQWKAFVEMQV